MSASLIGTMLWRARINFGSGLQDITNQVQVDAGAVIRRGRSDEQSSTTPASLTLSLKNSSGDFTPDNRDSQYWPGVKLRAPIVVDVSFDGGANWINRFTGGVDEWPQAFPGQVSTLAWTPLVASGVLRQYGQGATTLGSALTQQISDTGPVAWWRMDDGTGATRLANSIDSAHPLDSADPPTFATIDGPPGDTSKFASLGNAIAYNVSTSTIRTLLIHVTDLTLLNNPFGRGALIYNSSLGDLSLNGGASETVSAKSGAHTVTSGTIAAENGWYQVAATLTNGGGTNETLTLYVNGVSIGTSAFVATWTAGATTVQIACSTLGVAHFALFDTALTAQQISDLWDAAQGYIGETAGDRHERLCSQLGIATSGTNAALTPMGAQPNTTILELLQQGSTAEWAPLVETTGGNLDLHARTERYTDTAALTISSYRDLTPTYDDKDVCNIGNVTRTGGSYASSEDTSRSTAPPTGEGRYPKSLEVNVQSDDVLANYAAWLVATGVPQTRFRQVPIRYGPANLTALAAWCAAELNQLIDVSGLPGLLATDTFDGFLESYTETWTYNCCDVVLTLSAGHPWIDTFELDDTILGRLACSGQTMNANAIAGATSISVATSANNALLTTAAGDYPLDLMVNGYKIHATACSGVSSPQTVTVTALAHALTSGQEVTLWTKPVLGL